MGGNDRGGDNIDHEEDDDDNDFPPSPIVPDDQVPFFAEVLSTRNFIIYYANIIQCL